MFWIFQFLSRVADVLTDYLGDLNEDIIKDNFVIVYQVHFLSSLLHHNINMQLSSCCLLCFAMWLLHSSA